MFLCNRKFYRDKIEYGLIDYFTSNDMIVSTATECLSRIGASDQGLGAYNWATIGNGTSKFETLPNIQAADY